MKYTKQIHLLDRMKFSDKKVSHGPKTRIRLVIPGTDICIWEGHNKAVFTGSPFMIYNMFDVTSPNPNISDVRTHIPCYDKFTISKDEFGNVGTGQNSIFTLSDTTVSSTIGETADVNEAKCFLWCVGKGGATSNPSQVVSTQYASWIWPEDLIPFRFLSTDYYSITSGSDAWNQLNSSEQKVLKEVQDTYYGERILTASDGNKYSALYFKKIEQASIKIKRVGTGKPYLTNDMGNLKSNLENIYFESYSSLDENTTHYNTHELECFAELRLHIQTNELREWYIKDDQTIMDLRGNIELNNAAVNSISLCMATPIRSNDGTVRGYTNITPTTKLNFYSELLGDLEKGIDIEYQLYY